MKIIGAALLAAQSDIGTVVAKNAKNQMVKNRYADLGAVLDLVLPSLGAHGVIVLQGASEDGTRFLTRLIHAESGEELVSEVPLTVAAPPKGRGGGSAVNEVQMVGSALTYARRYGLMTALNLYAGDDDDGCGGRRPPRRTSPPRRRPESREQTGARDGSQSDLAARLFGVLTGCDPSNTPTEELAAFESAIGRSGTMQRLATVGVESVEEARDIILERARAAFSAADAAGNLSPDLRDGAAKALSPPDSFDIRAGVAACDALAAAALADDGEA